VSDVVIALHYQNEVVHPQGRIRLGIAEDSPERLALIAAAKHLLAAARACHVPVISVRIAFAPDYADVKTNAEIWRRVVANKVMAEGSWGAEFYDGLAPVPGEAVITHTRNDAFYASSLQSAVDRLAPSRLVVAGVATNFVVESTARHASDVGYDTVVVADACSAASPEVHRASLATLAMLATIRTVDDMIEEWGHST
jgi:nicotinamidase-related amidase